MAYNQNQGDGRGYNSSSNHNPYGQANPYDQRTDNVQSGPYSPPQAQGYGQQSNPYGQSGNGAGYGAPATQNYNQPGNPYDQRSNNTQAAAGYGARRPDLQQQGSSRYDEGQGQSGYEMSTMAAGNDPNRILKELRAIDAAVDSLTNDDLAQIRTLRERDATSLANDDNQILKELETRSDVFKSATANLINRLTTIKQDPESGNSRNTAQVGKVNRRLKSLINTYEQESTAYRRKMEDMAARQVKIVHPEFSDMEAREAAQEPNGPIFVQALMSSDRRGQAQKTVNSVQKRHQALQKLERDLLTLAGLYSDLEAAVVTQEAAIVKIDQQGEETKTQIQGGNTQLDGAVDKARAARRKKWILLGIIVAIIIVVVIIVVVVVEINKSK